MLNALTKPSSFAGLPPLQREIRVLLLDDSNFDRARIRRLSHRTALCVEMDEVASIAAMQDAVASENYDLILIDYRLPEGDGMQALDLILKNEMNRDAGKIMITGDGALETAGQAIDSGYHDFLSKDDMNAEALRKAMINAVTMARQEQLLVEARQRRSRAVQKAVASRGGQDATGNVVRFVRKSFSSEAPREHHIGQGSSDVQNLLARFGEDGNSTVH